MAETKRHVPMLPELTDAEASALGLLAVRRVVPAGSGRRGACVPVRIGDRVAHVHLHVVARYPGAPRGYYGPKVDDWPDAPHGGPDEIAACATGCGRGWRRNNRRCRWNGQALQ